MAQKHLETGDFVTPGDQLAVEEEFMPGENAFVDEGIVFSSATGRVEFDEKGRRVSVFPMSNLPPLPVQGDTVIAKVTYIRGQFAKMDIIAIEGEKNREIPSAPEGAVHISQARRNYVKDLDSQFQIGDIVRAKVVNTQRDPIVLSTVDDEFGVILAKCRECHGILVPKGKKLDCETCERSVNRKVSSVYGSSPF
jgi:exosome complex component CSL4